MHDEKRCTHRWPSSWPAAPASGSPRPAPLAPSSSSSPCCRPHPRPPPLRPRPRPRPRPRSAKGSPRPASPRRHPASLPGNSPPPPPRPRHLLRGPCRCRPTPRPCRPRQRLTPSHYPVRAQPASLPDAAPPIRQGRGAAGSSLCREKGNQAPPAAPNESTTTKNASFGFLVSDSRRVREWVGVGIPDCARTGHVGGPVLRHGDELLNQMGRGEVVEPESWARWCLPRKRLRQASARAAHVTTSARNVTDHLIRHLPQPLMHMLGNKSTAWNLYLSPFSIIRLFTSSHIKYPVFFCRHLAGTLS